MVVKSQIKFIKSLQQKKYRIEHSMFVVEGIKMVNELIRSQFKPFLIVATDRSLLDIEADFITTISESDLKKISNLKNPNRALGVFYSPKPEQIDFKDWIVVLDDIRDPGNLGTIMRLCDWYSIQHLVCSKNTVDYLNPKVLQATMGSIARVNINYVDLVSFLEEAELPIYGAFMDGRTVYGQAFESAGILVMGNEANGISKDIEKLIQSKISIPQFGQQTAESLNVATATAVLLNEIRRI